MPRDKRISKELLAHVRSQLRTAPKRDPESYKLEDAIADLMTDIKTCFGRGYDAASVADLLREAGIEYSKSAIVKLLPLKDGRNRVKSPAANIGIKVAREAQPKLDPADVGRVHGSRLHQETPAGVRTI